MKQNATSNTDDSTAIENKQTGNFLKQFKTARRTSTPILAIQSFDAGETIRAIATSYTADIPPIMQFDLANGLTGVNDEGRAVIKALFEFEIEDPISLFKNALQLPQSTILFVQNAHLIIRNAMMIQAIYNLRDEFKFNQRTLVLLCHDVTMPPELSNDVFVIEEALPTRAELSSVVEQAYEAASVDKPDMQTIEKAVDALSGLSMFPAEQATFMSMTPDGIDLVSLWDRKRKTIEQTPGLSVWRGGETFSDIGGLDNIKSFLSKVIIGKRAPKAILFLDEIEKAIAGSGSRMGDSSGVAQDQLATLLTWMQDNEATGIICIGPPGTSKSMIAKATGNEANVPTVQIDMGAMKGSLVGESEQRLRAALRVVKAISEDDVLVIATCNSIASLPPELRRRFTFGTFFFDLPTPEERDDIWEMYCNKYDLGDWLDLTLDDNGWTGAEVKQCCEIASRLNIEVEDASRFIVPVARSAADQIRELQQQASGRFISASESGIYESEMDKSKRTINEKSHSKKRSVSL